MKPAAPVPDPWPVLRAQVTDLQYVVFYCHLSLEAAAHHTGTTTGKVRAELTRLGPPPGFTEQQLREFLQR